jgi:phage shock protein A
MSEISNYIQDESVYHQQVACQQQTMISVLKEEILRLQEQIVGTEQSRDEYATLYEKALEEIHNLKDKISALRENNESLIQTFQVFQR